MRIGFYLLAGALVGLPILTLGFGAEARVHHHQRPHSTHFAPANASSPEASQNAVHGPQKSEDAPDKTNGDKQPGRHSLGAGQGGNDGPASSANSGTGTKENNLPEMKDLGPVDTHITIVRPRLQGAKAAMMRRDGGKTNPKNGKNFHARNTFVRHKYNPVVRNTIGVSIAPRDVTAGQRGTPAGASTDDRPDVQKDVVKVGPGLGPAGGFHPNVNTGRAFANRGTIGGSSFPHHGFVPSALGGQAKRTDGLSGSMVRPKY